MAPRNLLYLLLAVNTVATPLTAALSNEAAWYAEDLKQRGTIAALSWLVVQLIPYRQLAFKSIAALAACYFTADVITWPLWLWYGALYDITPWITAGVCVCLGLWYYFRSYFWPSDAIKPDTVYLVRKRPDSPQDLLLAMLGRQPLGGVSVLIDSTLWQFKHGVLVRRQAIPCRSKYVIMAVRQADAATISALTDLEGTKWTLAHNCITTLLPVALGGLRSR